ncbi:YqkE family protein [Paenibacillus harenae]|uniref:YqkE family protein n=1 Tax=Paenibacillus harenae TaxID=306543 RepID=UPI0003FBA2B6|nr:YqkE family protein [Paenibacillus harenae]
MGKKKNTAAAFPGKSAPQGDKEKPVLLNELLSADIVQKLKAKAEELSEEETVRKEALRKQEEEKKRQEQKKRENDFAYLLENSDANWSKYK